ncbi:MAG: TetR/AcrR family transcriptional regulator [Paramuribaculum sp.]|nr:TetR/AcrR family transcriptional regulator [Paramuribaculum sp.]
MRSILTIALPTFMVSKTRERLIEVAKQLFAYKGVENTTMNDIAAASEKGRRTIYTYFKNKREIYNAVVEQQSNQIIDRLKKIVYSTEMSSVDKLRNYLFELFDIIHQSSPRHEGYRRLLMRDHKRLSKIYRIAFDKERELFGELLRQGVESGEFDLAQASRLPSLVSWIIGSAYYPPVEDSDCDPDMSVRYIQNLTDFVVTGVTAAHSNNQSKQ